MGIGRKAAGEYPINISAATKVSQDEKEALEKKYGSMYAALRAGVKMLLGKP